MEWLEKLSIENLSGILDEFRPKLIHPDSPEWQPFYEDRKARFINGLWFPQHGQYRYVPGRIGWYGTMCKFEDWTEDKTRYITHPDIRDLEWMFTYFLMAAEGFSGFTEDKLYTCDRAVLSDMRFLPERRKKLLYQPNGKLKTYVDAREYLFSLHAKPLGYPLFLNEAKNLMIFGSRGGGKSYWTSMGVSLYDIVFDGLKYYEPFMEVNSKIGIELCAGQKKKYTEHADKILFALEQLRVDPDLGVWGDPNDHLDDSYEPSYFWKRMEGKLEPNETWINKYDTEIEGRVIQDAGTHSYISSVLYSMNDPAAAQKSAGGRRTKVIYEESGLIKYLIDAWGSNNGLVTANMEQQGVQILIGTSGNMEMVQDSRRIFETPNEYNVLPFRYDDKDYGFFLTSWMVDARFKDENGNTDVAAAKAEHERIYKEQENSKDPKKFEHHRMNFPLEIPDMWVTGEGSYFPVREARQRERELMKGKLYEELSTHVTLFSDPTHPRGVNYDIDHKAVPYTEWPISGRKTFELVTTIYRHPNFIDGNIPKDAYLFTYDPYVTDEMYKGGSLGFVHVWCNPKYSAFGFPGGQLCATMIGRPEQGLKHLHRQLELLLQYYGNPQEGLWYEANRGAETRSYFGMQKKLNLLCRQPQFSEGAFTYVRNSNRTGFVIGNSQSKIHLLDRTSDWLKQEITYREEHKEEPETKLTIFWIPCIFTIRQIIAFNNKDNFDAISSLIAVPLAFGEKEHIDKLTREQNTNAFSGFKKNIKKKHGKANYGRRAAYQTW